MRGGSGMRWIWILALALALALVLVLVLIQVQFSYHKFKRLISGDIKWILMTSCLQASELWRALME